MKINARLMLQRNLQLKRVKEDGLSLIKIKKQEGQRIYLVHDSPLSVV